MSCSRSQDQVHAGQPGSLASIIKGASEETKKNQQIEDSKSDAMKEAEHFVDVIHHFEHYGTHTFQKTDRLESNMNKIDPTLAKLVSDKYEQRLEAARKAIVVNHRFVREIVSNKEAFQSQDFDYDKLQRDTCRTIDENKMYKVRSTISQCVRDWSKDGAEERDQCYGKILRKLEELYPDVTDRSKRRVLVPGSGLGRLTWEVAYRGFFSQGNEFSYFMLLCSYVILNTMNKVEQTTIFPYVWDWKNLFSAKDQMKMVKIPDVNPSALPPNSQFSMVAGDFLEVFNDTLGTWDAVTTCYFIDTAHNILEYIKLIGRLLVKGGHWINFGPLLYHFSDMRGEMSIELTWEEIKLALPGLGFELISEEGHIPSRYTSNPASMLQQQYSCVFFHAKKI